MSSWVHGELERGGLHKANLMDDGIQLNGVDGGENPIEAPTPYGCNSCKLGTKLDFNATSRCAHL